MSTSAGQETPSSGDAPRQPAAPVQHQAQPLPSEALLRGRKQVEITHNGEVYRLQATRLGKLILTK